MTHALPPPERLATGLDALDGILRGGLRCGGLYVIAGRPGVGKTILAHQIAFASAKRAARVVYATLLGEAHERLLDQMRTFSFFDEHLVGRELVYHNLFSALREEGLQGLLQRLRSSVRDHAASMLVLDGAHFVEALAQSGVEYMKFLLELQAWIAPVACTGLLLSTGGRLEAKRSEHSAVDGILELSSQCIHLEQVRHLRVAKFRGGPHAEGRHLYRIAAEGMTIYPRLEACDAAMLDVAPLEGSAGFGVSGLDDLFGGGVARGSTTLLLGPSGAGKTILGLHFLAAGAAAGEKVLHVGLYETPAILLRKGDRLGMRLTHHLNAGRLLVHWQRPSEPMLDKLAADILAHVEREGVQRLFFDGLAGLRTAVHAERLSGIFAALSGRLAHAGVTTFISEETRELYVKEVAVPTSNVSAIFDNIVLLRRVLLSAQLVHQLSILKTRDTPHDNRAWEFALTNEGVFLVAPFDTPRARRLRGGGSGSGALPKAKRVRLAKVQPKKN